jgi:hypothetical protein
MSRGHGAVELAILAAIDKWPQPWTTSGRYSSDELNARDLARLALGVQEPTRNQIEATRRAAHRLTDQGHLEEIDHVGGLWAGEPWVERDHFVGWRKPWTQEQHDAWHQMSAEAQGRDDPIVFDQRRARRSTGPTSNG